METLKHIITRRWGYILVALISGIMSFATKQPTWWLAILSIIIGIIEERREWERTYQEKQLQIMSDLRKLTQEFQRKFVNMGSTYSIFYQIRELGNAQSEKQGTLKGWADGCIMGLDFFQGWLHSFIGSLNLVVEQKVKQEKELSERFEEFQHMNHSYYCLVEAFYERAKTGNIPELLEKYYNEFVTEYNAFIQKLRNIMDEARKIPHLNIIDSKSTDFAKELHIARWG